MKQGPAAVAALFLIGLLSATAAAASDLAEGEELYVSQCQLCHGSLKQENAFHAPLPALQLAMLDNIGAPETVVDGRIAFAPPFGPHLRGVVGRSAGSVEGYTYSNTMLKTLKGMEWTEAALNVWITNPQAWVPGVYMYYKQKDPEIRRKIILYLKANS